MIDAKKYLLTASVAAVLGIAAAGMAFAGDEPKAAPDSSNSSTESASKPAADSGHIMMDHSIGDPKSMGMMKDKTVLIHHAGDAPAKSGSSGCKDHVMMDHSVGDPKSMNMMKDKKVPIHHSGDAATPAAESTSK